MRLVTFQDAQGVHIGALRDAATIVPLDTLAPDMLALIDGGAALLEQARALLASPAETVRLADVRLLAPIPRPRQNVICIGMNYVAHAIESQRARGQEPKLPQHPVFFTKAVTSVCGPEDGVPLDTALTTQLDYEVELAVVIGTTGKNIGRDNALAHVFGYTIVNDVSAREIQVRHQQFHKGKSLDNTCPMGPCIVTADEIPDPTKLRVQLRLNGEPRQDSTVADLIFDIPALIEVYSRGTTLEAGSIIATGTPSGVGLGLEPQQFMQVGDVMEAEIQPIGVLRNQIVAP